MDARCFMSQLQLEFRSCESIRFPMIVSVPSDTHGTTIPEALYEIQTMFCKKGTIKVHGTINRHECIFSFTDDDDARVAYVAIRESFRNVAPCGAILYYRQWHPADEFGIDLADNHILVIIKDMPLYLWTEFAVEYILSPYCALEFTEASSKPHQNLVSYKCTAWSQNQISVPSVIKLYVPADSPLHHSTDGERRYKRVFTFRISLEVRRIQHGVPLDAQYQDPTTVLNSGTATLESEAECYLPVSLCSRWYRHKYSEAFVCTRSATQMSLSDVEFAAAAKAHFGCDLNVQSIGNNKYIVQLPSVPDMSNIRARLLNMQGEFILEPWTPTFGSFMESLHDCIKVHVKRVPPHMCTHTVVRFILGRFCYPETTDYAAVLDETSEDYQCTAWCKDIHKIPKVLNVKILPKCLAALYEVCANADVRLATTRINIDVNYADPTAICTEG